MSSEAMNSRIRDQLSDRVQNGREISNFAERIVENRKRFHSNAFDLTEAGEHASEKRKKKKPKSSADNRFAYSNQKAKDKYCWLCHKGGQIISCSCCCRGYHLGCLNFSSADIPSGWICTECRNLSHADCTVFYASKWAGITKDQLVRMLIFLIDRLAMQSWSKHFREPLNESIASGYYTMVVHSVNLREMRSDVLAGRYSSVHSFVSEFRWIFHNSVIFNGLNSPVTAQARLLDIGCTRETAVMRACPSCYLVRIPALSLLPSTSKILPLLGDSVSAERPSSRSPSHSSSPCGDADGNAIPPAPIVAGSLGAGSSIEPSDVEFDPWWFCFVCDVAHPIVWVRLKHYPRWPAKVICLEEDANILVSFFGDYDLTAAPIGSVMLHSESHHAKLPLSMNWCQLPAVTAAPTLDPIGSPPSTISEHSSMQTVTPPPPPISPGSPNSSYSLVSMVSGSRSRRASSEKLVLLYPNYRQAMLELDRYVAGLRERWPHFVLPPSKHTDFTRRNVEKYYGSHLYESVDVSTKTITSSIGLAPQGQSIVAATFSVTSSTGSRSSISSSFTQSVPPPATVGQATSNGCESVRASSPPPSLVASSNSHSGNNIALCSLLNSGSASSPREPSSQPASIRTSLSDQGVLARVAATLRDARPFCPMPSVPAAYPVPESSSPTSPPPGDVDNADDGGGDAEGDTTILAVTADQPVSPGPIPPSLIALESAMTTASQADNTETTRQVIDRYRVQLNEMLVKLADTLSAQEIPDTASSANSTSTQCKVIDAEVQTSINDCELPSPPVKKRPCPSPESEAGQPLQAKRPETASVSTSTDKALAPASSLQVAMMEEEIERLDNEVNRLNVLLNLTRLEMGVETRRRMAELRRVWAAEVTAVLDAAIRIWEQDVVKLVDNVKRKQWCAYCGRVAYYYCCWNTCYCDNACQSKHWAVHINSCVQARGHQQQPIQPAPVQTAASVCAPAATTGKFNSVPTVARPASGTATCLPLGVSSQAGQQVVVAATAAAAGLDQHQARYQHHHQQHQQQANRLQNNLQPAGVGAGTVVPTASLSRQMDLPPVK